MASAAALLWLLLEALASYIFFPTEQTCLGQEIGTMMVRSPMELSCQTAVEPHMPGEWEREALHVQLGSHLSNHPENLLARAVEAQGQVEVDYGGGGCRNKCIVRKSLQDMFEENVFSIGMRKITTRGIWESPEEADK